MLVRRVALLSNCSRAVSSAAYLGCKSNELLMQAWQIHSYGELDELQFSKSARIPHITKPDDIMVEVSASSVNPIDIAMLGGYGSGLLGVVRQLSSCSLSKTIEFPLTLGRDFAGRVVGKGHGVGSSLELDDEVWGAVPPHSQGCHAGRVVVDKSLVVATCSTDAVHLVESLGASCVIDYTRPDASKLIREEGKYDIIMDAAGLGADEGLNYVDCLKDWNLSKYVTLRSPLLRNVDSYGLVPGMAKNAVDLLVPNLLMTAGSVSSTVRWGFFMPIPGALQELTQLVEEGKVMPLVEKVYKFSDLPAAYEQVKSGHLRGKVVLMLEDSVEDSACEQAEHRQ